MYQRILLPLDGSELAEAAIPHAVAIARAFDAEIVPMQATALQVGPAAHGMAAARTENTREAATYLHAVAERLAGEGVQIAEVVIEEGIAGPTVIHASVAHRCDLIVMGTHGRSGIDRALLGSVAEYVERHSASVPVLLVRSAARPD